MVVSAQENGYSALDFLKGRGFSRRAIISLKNNKGLTRGGALLRTVDPVYEGETVTVKLTDEGALLPNPNIQAAVVYEDEDVIVFDKPPFVAVHPSILHYDDTLGNLFAALCEGLPFRPVNRLDRNTSGLCVCAKNRFAAAGLAGSIEKVYYAVVDGEITEGGCIDQPIDRESESIIKRCVSPTGKPARTHFSPEKNAKGRTLLCIVLETGRTHQIRVHFSHIGYPLCGDDMYGGDMSAIDRQALHCGEVSFVHPVTKEKVTLKAQLPQDMAALLE